MNCAAGEVLINYQNPFLVDINFMESLTLSVCLSYTQAHTCTVSVIKPGTWRCRVYWPMSARSLAFLSFHVNKEQVTLHAIALHSRVSVWMFSRCAMQIQRWRCASPIHLKSDPLKVSKWSANYCEHFSNSVNILNFRSLLRRGTDQPLHLYVKPIRNWGNHPMKTYIINGMTFWNLTCAAGRACNDTVIFPV